MKIREIAELLQAKVLCSPQNLEYEIEYAFASDLMSDVLTVENEQLILITGLVNLQSIRTAEMLDINCILYVRNKKVTPEMVKLAEDKEITLLEYEHSLFSTCATLANIGIKPVF